MKKLLLAFFLLSSPAFAQSVTQSGSITPGHGVRWVSNGVIGDSGTAANGSLTSLGVTNNGGPGICVNSAATSGAYNQICLAATTNGGAKISSYAYGGATSPGITFDINGSVQGFPAVTLPVSDGDFACFDGTTGQLRACGGGGTRTRLTGDTTFYLNPSSSSSSPCGAFTCSAGSDSNSGLLVTAPFLTAQHAIDVIKNNYDLAGFVVTLQLADGTTTSSAARTIGINDQFTGAQTSQTNTVPSSCPVIIQGNASTPGNTIIDNTSSGDTIGVSGASFLCIQNLEVRSSGGGASLRIANGTLVRIGNIRCGVTGISCLVISHAATLESFNGTTLFITGAQPSSFATAWYQGSIFLRNTTINFQADITPTQFVWASRGGQLSISNNTYTMNGHTVTGKKFTSELWSGIDTDSAGLSALPGSVAGTVDSASTYDSFGGYNLFSQVTNLNAAASLPARPTGTIWQWGQADGVAANTVLDSWGTGNPSNVFVRHARGTAASPSAIQSGDIIGNFAGIAYGSTAYSTGLSGQVGVTLKTTQAWTDAAQGTAINFYTTANGTTSAAVGATVDNTGFFGIGTTTPQSKLHVNGNATSNVAGITGSLAQFTQVDTTNGIILESSYGTGVSSILALRHARGTAASSSALQSGDQIGTVGAIGFGATVYSSAVTGNAGITFLTSQIWTDAAQGTAINLFTTPNGSTTPASVVTIGNSGGVTVPSTVTGGDKGAGTINASGQIYVAGNTVGSSATSPVTLSATTGVIACATCGVTSSGLNQFASTTSAQLGGVISDETGAGGLLVFNSAPVFSTSITSVLVLGGATTTSTLSLQSTSGAGTTGADIIFKVGNNGATEAARFLNSGFHGIGTNNPQSKLHVNANTTQNPAASSNTLAQISAADATQTHLQLDGFGSYMDILERRANGTAASPSAVSSGDPIGGFNVAGYHSGAAYGGNVGSIFFLAAENFTSTNQGTLLDFYSTPTAATAAVRAVRVQASGGVSIGATTDPGVGGLYVNGATITLNGLATDATHTDRTVCQDTTSKSLFFGSGAAGICLGTSSARFKRDIVDSAAGLADVLKLRPVNFYYLPGYGGEQLQYGFIAEEVIRAIPTLVGLDAEHRPNSVDMLAMVPILTKAVQELSGEVEALKRRRLTRN